MEETDGERLTVDPQEKSTWRSGVRSAMPDVDDAPAPAF